jgi:hypothetical protein
VADDRAALVALYEATDGDNWSYNENWLSDQPMGEWDGVETGRDGRVTRLWLESNELNGEIPSELGDLPSLVGLWLWGNDLSGEIPGELGSLTNLVNLSLGGNQLRDQIPPELGNLSSLQYLYLDSNQLRGILPLDLTKLTNLQEFNFHNNPDLCAPTDEAFETWLQGIDNWEGNSCAVADDRAAPSATTPPATATPTPIPASPQAQPPHVMLREERRVTVRPLLFSRENGLVRGGA